MVGQRPALWRRLAPIGVGLAIAALAAFGVAQVVGGSGKSGSSPSAQPTPAPPALATTGGEATGQTVEGVPCESPGTAPAGSDAHLAVFVNGEARTIPAGIGAPGAVLAATAQGVRAQPGPCLYALHTLSADGIVRIRPSASQQAYTLGELFAIWGQPLTAGQVGPATGGVIAYVDGQQVNGNPGDIPLKPHAVIQLDVGADVPAQSYDFPAGL